jgi:hypothetical protein
VIRLRVPSIARLIRCSVFLLAATIVLSSCAEDEVRELRLTPTSTVETGVRVLADNCPGPDAVYLSVRDEVLWTIERIPTVEESGGEVIEQDTATAVAEPIPGLVEFLIGRAPDDWRTTTALAEPLTPGIRYTVRTEPDGQSIDFSTPDLSPGLLWDGTGNAQFNPDLIQVECSQPADVEGFARNIVVLLALWVTTAAIIMVAIILVLFVITRRFSRVRSLQKRAEREALAQSGQRRSARSKS